MSDPKTHETSARLVKAQTGAVASGDQASNQAFARLDWGEAPTVGILGKSGTGKTEAARRLIRAYLRKSRGVVIVIDDKELKPRYEGQYFRDPSFIKPGDLKPEPRVVVFRGVPGQMIGVDHEEVARYQQGFAARGVPTLCVHDEQSDAAKYGQWLAGSQSLLARQYVKGRVVGVGKLWLTQHPEYVPAEPWSQSTAILCFNVDDGTLRRLEKGGWVDERLARIIRALPDGDVPPAQRGAFLLLKPNRASDGQRYRYDLKSR